MTAEPDWAAGAPAPPVVFGEEVEARLAGVDLPRVLAEKREGTPRPPTRKEILATYPAPQEELDLHGCTGPEAAGRTPAFINAVAALRLRTVRIITGKGKHSPGPAVLPPVVEAALAELQRSGRIFHYSWGPKGMERSGAVVVYL